MAFMLIAQGEWLALALQQMKKKREYFEGAVCCVSTKEIGNELPCENFVPIPESRRLSDAILLSLIEDCKPDYLLSIQYPWIIGKSVIDKMDGMIFNIHNAKLPAYRGHNSISHVLYNQDEKHFTTLHRISVQVDRGHILREESVEIDNHDTAIALWQRSVKSLVRLIEFVMMNDIASLDGPPVGSAGSYYSKRSIEKLKKVDIGASLDEKMRVARACWFPPHEPAYYLDWDGEKIYIDICDR